MVEIQFIKKHKLSNKNQENWFNPVKNLKESGNFSSIDFLWAII